MLKIGCSYTEGSPIFILKSTSHATIRLQYNNKRHIDKVDVDRDCITGVAMNHDYLVPRSSLEDESQQGSHYMCFPSKFDEGVFGDAYGNGS